MKKPPNPNQPKIHGRNSNDHIAGLFEKNGWKIDREPGDDRRRPDLLVRKGPHAYVIEVKAMSEGRADRVIPLLSQAILQAQAYARKDHVAKPLAVIQVGDVSPSLLKQVRAFLDDFAADVSVGVVSENGGQYFQGKGLEKLNIDPPAERKAGAKIARSAPDLFSDLNQWLLKVLLAPHIPERLLAAPRPGAEFRNASELANAASVSVMSAFRFVSQLQGEGFLDEHSQRLKLVRLEELFRRWSAAALRPSLDVPMKFLLRGAPHSQLREFVSNHHACAGLFAAADALKLGHVHGVAPHAYVQRIPRLERDKWEEILPAGPGEPADLVVRQARAPNSVFRGAIQADGMLVSDVIQIWLDVSVHPSRGQEQADFIYRKVLKSLVEGKA